MLPENMCEVVVYLDKDYERSQSISIEKGLEKTEITKIVNERFGKKGWFYYDIF